MSLKFIPIFACSTGVSLSFSLPLSFIRAISFLSLSLSGFRFFSFFFYRIRNLFTIMLFHTLSLTFSPFHSLWLALSCIFHCPLSTLCSLLYLDILFFRFFILWFALSCIFQCLTHALCSISPTN